MTSAPGGYSISTDTEKLDIKVIHGYLTRSYWAHGISEEKVERSIRASLCFGLYYHGAQVGFARVLTDYVHTALLADVFVLEEHRGRGLGKWLVSNVVTYPDLQGLRRWTLATRDAHGLYRQFGFKPLAVPERFMQFDPPCNFGAEA
jgi:GNAT superfamily N-acetyltransferase